MSRKSTAQRLNDITDCPVCFQPINGPRLLPCIHVFCLKCLERHGGDIKPGAELSCPTCRAECLVPETGLEGLPRSLFIERMLHIRDVTNKRIVLECDVCKAKEETSETKTIMAIKYCVECDEKLCRSCSIFHGHSKISRNHKMMDIDDLDRMESVSICRTTSTPCPKHQDQRLTFFCRDCKIAICLHCNIASHKQHNCCDIGEVVQEVRQSMNKDVKGLSHGVVKLNELLESVEEQKMGFTQQTIDAKEAIFKKAEKLMKQVDRNKQALLTELESRKDDILNLFENFSSETTKRITFMNSLKKYTEELSNKGAAGDIIQESSIVHQRVEELLMIEDIEKSRSNLGVSNAHFTESKSMQTCGNVIGEIDVKIILRVKPTIEKSPNDVKVTNLERIRFETTVTGKPEPSVEWFKGEAKLSSSAKVSIEKNGDVYALLIKQVSRTDEGEYTVKATNGFGTATASATLKVTVRKPSVKHIIPTTRGGAVSGVTSLNDQLFVVRYKAQQVIEVYDTETFVLQQIISVPGLANSYGLTSCNTHRCLYVTDYFNKKVNKVLLTGKVTDWALQRQPTGVSVNKATNVLISCPDSPSILLEYNTAGGVVGQINLPSITYPWLAIPLRGDQIAVCSNNEVHVVSRYGGKAHKYSVKLKTPAGLALVESGDILVANQETNQLLVVNSSLSSTRQLSLPEGVTLQNPRTLCLDSSRGRLYVGEWNGRVLILDDIFNEVPQPTLAGTILGQSQVVGVTSLNNKLFVVRQDAQEEIEVYDTTTFEFQRHISVPGLVSTTGGLASCPVNRCLYVSNTDCDRVYRVGMPNIVTRWNVISKPTGLSMSKANNVVVAGEGPSFAEYTTQGSLVRIVDLHSAGISNPFHAIHLTTGQYAVSQNHRFSVVNQNGQLVHHYAGSVQLNSPVALAQAKSGCFIVASQGTNTLVVIHQTVSCARVLSLSANVSLQSPRALYLDESRDRLYVGEYNGSRVLVFDNVSKIGNDFDLCCVEG